MFIIKKDDQRFNSSLREVGFIPKFSWDNIEDYIISFTSYRDFIGYRIRETE